LHVV
jgi:hypothetical protein